MTEKYNELQKKYKIVERTEELLKSSTVEDVKEKLEKELEEINNYSGHFFGDCVGHAHTCITLQLEYLKSKQ